MLDLESAIKHCEEQANLLEESAAGCDMTDKVEKEIACRSGKCAAEHRQLAEWLRELKERRAKNEADGPKRGRWIKPTGMMPPEHHGHYECSECGAWALRDWKKPWIHSGTNGAVLTNYCSNCGAKMTEVANEETAKS